MFGCVKCLSLNIVIAAAADSIDIDKCSLDEILASAVAVKANCMKILTLFITMLLNMQ